MTYVRTPRATLALLTLLPALICVAPSAATATAAGQTALQQQMTGTGWQGPIKTRAILSNGAIRVTAVAECADITGGESSVTMTVSQVDRQGRVVSGAGQAYADCYPRSDGGQDGRVTIPVRPEGPGAFHPGSAFTVRDDLEGIRLGDDFGYFDAEVRWAELDVRRPGATLTSAAVTRARLSALDTSLATATPGVRIDRVSAKRVSGGAGAVVRVHGTCVQGAEFGFAERVSVTVRQRVSGSVVETATKDSTAFDSLACESPDPGWIDVPVIPDALPFRAGRAAVRATYTASFGEAPATFDVSDSFRARRIL